MTVEELKEKLNQFPNNLIVMIPNSDLHRLSNPVFSVPAQSVTRGCNEEDGCLFIDSCEEDDDNNEIQYEYDDCYECRGYGNDYFLNDDDEYECFCPYCLRNPTKTEDYLI